MQRTLRPAVEISPLPEGMQLTDTDTGFAVELEPRYVTLLDGGSGDAADELWAALSDMGLADLGLDPIEIRRRQRRRLFDSHPEPLQRLHQRLEQIREQVPYFRDRRDTYDPQRLAILDDLGALPFMRKRDLRRHFPDGLIPVGTDLAAGLRDGSLALVSTSGSTDDRLQVVVRVEIERHPFGCSDLYGVPMGGRQPRTAFLTTPVCSGVECHLGGASYEARLSNRSPDLMLNSTTDPFAIRRDLLDSFCAEVTRFQPEVLLVDAIYLQCFIRAARQHGAVLPRVPFVQYGFEFGHRAAVRDIVREFGVPVLNDYGASEENRLALECHRGSLHVRSDAVHIEIVGRNGACPPGVVGAIAITTFDSLTPLVRYLIGDGAAWTGRRCDCAFAEWPTLELHGRLKDMIHVGDRWVSTLDVDRAIGAPDWLDLYQVIQLGPRQIQIKVIPALGARAEIPDLLERLSGLFAPDLLQIDVVTRIDPLPSLKIGLTLTRTGGAPEIP